MDFVTSLQKSQGYDVILVIMILFRKLPYMVPTMGTATALETAKLFVNTSKKHYMFMRSAQNTMGTRGT
jgi:hypothetical protein